MSIPTMVLCGLTAGGVIVLVGLLVQSVQADEEKRPRGYQPTHREVRDVEAPLPPARWLDEDQVVSFPAGHPELARAFDTAPLPVLHVGADEDWSPKGELPAVQPLDPQRTVVRRRGATGRRLRRVVSADELFHRQLGRALDPILDELARAGQEGLHTCEWTSAEVADMLVDRDPARADR